MAYIVAWMFVVGLGAIIGHYARGRGGDGAWWSFLLGPLGLLAIFALADDRPHARPAWEWSRMRRRNVSTALQNLPELRRAQELSENLRKGNAIH